MHVQRSSAALQAADFPVKSQPEQNPRLAQTRPRRPPPAPPSKKIITQKGVSRPFLFPAHPLRDRDATVGYQLVLVRPPSLILMGDYPDAVLLSHIRSFVNADSLERSFCFRTHWHASLQQPAGTSSPWLYLQRVEKNSALKWPCSHGTGAAGGSRCPAHV